MSLKDVTPLFAGVSVRFSLGHNYWLFAGYQRVAAMMSIIQSAKLNGHDSYAYLKDVLARLPMPKTSQIEKLQPVR
jgi:hypothetical protein